MPAGMRRLTGFHSEDGSCRFLQYVCTELPEYAASITENIFILSTIRNLYLAQLSENSRTWRQSECLNQNFFSVLSPEFKDSKDCKPQYRKHTAVPVKCMSCPLAWSLGTGSCLVLVIYFSHLNVVFKSAQFSVIWMLFTNLHDFISYFFVPLLQYSIMLLLSIYENMTTEHASGSVTMHQRFMSFSPFQIIIQKSVPFPSVMISISIWTDIHRSHCGPCRWCGRRLCVVLAHSGTSHRSALGRWLTPLCNRKRREIVV
jgi:hypothetical protein